MSSDSSTSPVSFSMPSTSRKIFSISDDASDDTASDTTFSTPSRSNSPERCGNEKMSQRTTSLSHQPRTHRQTFPVNGKPVLDPTPKRPNSQLITSNGSASLDPAYSQVQLPAMNASVSKKEVTHVRSTTEPQSDSAPYDIKTVMHSFAQHQMDLALYTAKSTVEKVSWFFQDSKDQFAASVKHGPLVPSRQNAAYYQHLMDVAVTYEQWYAAAETLDRIEGKQAWKSDPQSKDYDYELLSSRLEQLKVARQSYVDLFNVKVDVEASGDILSMIFLLRTSLSRNLADMGNSALYAECRVGTKRLIDDYIDEVTRQLDLICDQETPELSIHDKLELFINTRQSFGRTALLLSGGATLGLNHIGVIKALHESNLLPRIICGSSIGSLVAATICCQTDNELLGTIHDGQLNLNALERPEEEGSMFYKISRFLKHGTLLDVEVLKESIRANVGDVTFQEAYNRTRRILNITVSSSTKYEMPRLLNYLTAPNVLIWSAVAASCAIPLVYKSAPLMARDKQGNIVAWNPSGHCYIDGSVDNDLPMMRLSELFNVNHFIVSQVNPHVVPFLDRDLKNTPSKRFVRTALSLARSELIHRLDQLIELDIFPTFLYKTKQIFSQKYGGDITIIPNVKLHDYISLMSNPSQEGLWDAIIRGEKATWQLMSIVRNHCQIEIALDNVIYRARIRRLEHVATSPYPAIGFDNGGYPVAPTAIPITYSLVDMSQLGVQQEAAANHRTVGDASTSLSSPQLTLARSRSFGHSGGHALGGVLAKAENQPIPQDSQQQQQQQPKKSGVPRRVKKALRMTSTGDPSSTTLSARSETPASAPAPSSSS